MKIAIVHDQLREFGGAERVLVSLKKVYPDADVFTSTFDINALGKHKELIKSWNVKTSWFGQIPIINRLYSPLRFLTPLIWESLDLSGYDLVISSTGSWMCKGIKTHKPTVHISYIHHPPRYLYGYQTAIEWQKYVLIRIYGMIVNHFLRMWDFEATKRPDFLIANSYETKKRIFKFYRRDSTVIYPPVTVPKRLANWGKTEMYFITVSRLAKAKHIDLLIRTASINNIPLKVVGVGRDMDYLKTLAGNTVEFLGNVTDAELDALYDKAYGFLFSSVDEEFGIAPVEAMAHGVPVIAYASGGLIETVKDGENGYLFHDLSESSLLQKIRKLQSLSNVEYETMRQNARKDAEKYSEERFMNEMRSFIHTVLHP